MINHYRYLTRKLDISDDKQLRERVLERCAELDMNEMAEDVAPFLFDPTDTKKIRQFEAYIKQADLSA